MNTDNTRDGAEPSAASAGCHNAHMATARLAAANTWLQEEIKRLRLTDEERDVLRGVADDASYQALAHAERVVRGILGRCVSRAGKNCDESHQHAQNFPERDKQPQNDKDQERRDMDTDNTHMATARLSAANTWLQEEIQRLRLTDEERGAIEKAIGRELDAEWYGGPEPDRVVALRGLLERLK